MPPTNPPSTEAPSTAPPDGEQLTNRICVVCGGDGSHDALVVACDCQAGVYHLDCLEEMIPEKQWQFDGAVLCLGCDIALEEDTLKQILEPVVLQKYKLRQIEVQTPFIMRTYCYVVDCETWIPSAFGQSDGLTAYCPKCSRGTCTKCKGPVHPAYANCKDIWEKASEKYGSKVQTQDGTPLCPACARPAVDEEWTCCNERCWTDFCLDCRGLIHKGSRVGMPDCQIEDHPERESE